MSINILIFAIKLFIFLKRLIAAFFVNLVFKPGWLILRFVFYKVVVKIYKFYLFLIRKIKFSPIKNNSFVNLANQKFIHIFVAIITIIIISSNLTARTRAETLADNANKTILSQLIKSEFESIEDEQLVEEFFDEEAIISPVQQNYLDDLKSVRLQPAVHVVQEEEETKSIITQGGAALVKPEIASTKKTKRQRNDIIDYLVNPGDTISTIASEFEISVNTILWENNLNAYSIIRPGDKLALLPVSGVMHNVGKGENLSSIAKRYNIEEQEIMSINRLADSSKLAMGQKIIIPGGNKTSYSSSRSSLYSGINVIRDLVKSPNAAPAAGNKMNWPTAGHRVTQYYSWRHHAVDIANKVGTPIYAADAGTVEYSGWGKGYGNQLIINHGGGKKTRYAHLSKFYVKKGGEVNKGEIIAAMGSTGWSTGSHLHFEVIIEGAKYNPLNYIK